MDCPCESMIPVVKSDRQPDVESACRLLAILRGPLSSAEAMSCHLAVSALMPKLWAVVDLPILTSAHVMSPLARWYRRRYFYAARYRLSALHEIAELIVLPPE
jgi:hypothetical protein